MSTVVRAPATVANVGPGFDVFGLAVDGFHDVVEVREWEGGVRVVTDDPVPRDPERNTAGFVAMRMVEEFDLPGVELVLRKGVPVGGLGSSAASAVGAAVAVDREFGLGLGEPELLRFAAEGERVAAGEPHFDNVAPCLLGGFVVWRSVREYVRLEPPGELRLVTATPVDVRVSTEEARRALREDPPGLEDVVENLSAVALMVHAVHEGDVETFVRMMDVDRISEPVRSKFVPGYRRLEEAAREAGALAFTVSGAGPTVVAACLKGDERDVEGALREAAGEGWVVRVHRPESGGALGSVD